MEGIKNKVAIIGMGCTKFGERWDADAEDLMVEAFTEAIEDAGIELKDIQAAWLGIQHTDTFSFYAEITLHPGDSCREYVC